MRSFAPKVPAKKGPTQKIKDLVVFNAFADEHGHLTAELMVQN